MRFIVCYVCNVIIICSLYNHIFIHSSCIAKYEIFIVLFIIVYYILLLFIYLISLYSFYYLLIYSSLIYKHINKKTNNFMVELFFFLKRAISMLVIYHCKIQMNGIVLSQSFVVTIAINYKSILKNNVLWFDIC